MRRIILFASLILLVSSVFAVPRFVPPTTPASNITFTIIDGSFIRVQWTAGNGARRIVVARAGSAVTAVPVNGVDYNASVTFGSGDAIQPGQFVVFDNVGALLDITGLQPNTTYHFAVYEYNGTGATTEYIATAATGSQATVAPPTLQATNVVFSNVTGNSVQLTWTNGNGSGRMVLAKAISAVDANPVDLITYSASTFFGSGTQIGTGNFVVFIGTANTVTVTNLSPNTTYHFAVLEYNGSSGHVLNIAGPAAGSQLTTSAPTVAASNLTFSIIDGNFLRLQWTNGNGGRRIVVARAGSPVTAVPVNGVDYNSSNTFGSGDAILPGQFVVYDNNSNLVDVTGLQGNTTYHFRIYEYDGTGAAASYLTSTFVSGSQITSSPPTIQASAIIFSNVTGNSLQLTWTNGNGAGRIVLAKAVSAVDANPVDLTLYSGNASFGSGTQIGSGNFVVFRGVGNTVTVTNLSPNTTYHFAVFENNGSSGPVYNTVSPATGSQATAGTPTVAASNLTFTIIEGNFLRLQWTNGNGGRRIVVARSGSAVDAVPVNGTDYVENPNFALAGEISPGQRVVYDNTGSLADITGLQSNTTYHFRIYEYNGTGVNILYLTASFVSGSQSTTLSPTIQATNLTFSTVSANSVQLTWTNGNGIGRIVLAKAVSAVDANPVDNTSYSASATLGNGTQIGSGNFVVFRGVGNTVTVTNLAPNTTYHFAVFENNGNSGPVFNIVSPATGSQLTAGAPTIAASNLAFTIVDGNFLRLEWTNGNGARRIVVARAGSAVNAVPVNGVDYNANATFGSGDAILPGQFVLYDNTGSLVDISGLLGNTVYHFRIYEYDGTGVNILYLTAAFGSGSRSTSITPTLQASNLLFSSVTGNSLTAGLTIGNGTSRMVVVRQGSPVNVDPVDLVNYSANGTFGSGTQIGTGNFVVGRTSTTSVNVTGLASGTTYYFAAYEYNGTGGPVFLLPGTTGSTTTLGVPQTQATAAMAASVTSSTMQINWSSGSGNRRIVLMKAGGPVDANPVDNTPYTANSFFGSGSQLGSGNFVVFNGTGSTVLVTGLASSTVYHFAVFEYNSFGVNSQFLLTNPAISSAATSAGLPVTFIDFTATHDRNGILLSWSTAQEQNSSHFDIERSNDGRNYITVGNVTAAGESTTRKDYSFTDIQPVSGLNYYRLKQLDKDNNFTYSKVVSARYEQAQLLRKITNPVHGTMVIELTAYNRNAPQGNEWKLFDLQGRMVRKGIITGIIIYADMSLLPSGLYMLELRADNKKEIVKIIKQ